MRGDNVLDKYVYSNKPVKPDPKERNGLLDWCYKNMLYKMHLQRYEALLKVDKSNT